MVEAGLAVKVDQDGTTFAHQFEHFQIAAGRAVDHSSDFAIEQHAKRCFFLFFVFVRVANQDRIAVRSGLVLDAFDKGSEKIITNVRDNHSDGSGLLGAEGTRTTWLVMAITMDRGEDSFTSGGRHNILPVSFAGGGGGAQGLILGGVDRSE